MLIYFFLALGVCLSCCTNSRNDGRVDKHYHIPAAGHAPNPEEFRSG